MLTYTIPEAALYAMMPFGTNILRHSSDSHRLPTFHQLIIMRRRRAARRIAVQGNLAKAITPLQTLGMIFGVW